MRIKTRGVLALVGAVVLLTGLLSGAIAEEDSGLQETFTLGVSFEGLWLGEGEVLGLIGGSLGIGVTERTSFVFHFSTRAIEILGIGLSVSFFDAAVSVALTPASEGRLLYIFGGGGYMHAEVESLLGGGLIFAGGGLGLELPIGESGGLFIQYRLRAIDFEDLYHAVEGGFSLSF